MSLRDPDIILDVLFEKGKLYFILKNLGDKGAYSLKCEFSNKIIGVHGKVEITALNIFHKLEYLAPHKEIRIFIDTAASYFQRKQPDRFQIVLNWSGEESLVAERKNPFTRSITHNMEVYKDFGYLNPIE